LTGFEWGRVKPFIRSRRENVPEIFAFKPNIIIFEPRVIAIRRLPLSEMKYIPCPRTSRPFALFESGEMSIDGVFRA